MRYLWLVGLVAVVGLALAAGLRAQERAPRGEGVKQEHKAGQEGKEGGERGERTRTPEVKLTAEQETALAPAVAELKAALAKFKEAVKAAGLSEREAQAYTMRTIFGQLRSERPRGEKKTEGGTEK